MNQKLAKMAAKAVVGSGIAFVLGVIVKLEHRIDDKIDDHYDSKKVQPEPES